MNLNHFSFPQPVLSNVQFYTAIRNFCNQVFCVTRNSLITLDSIRSCSYSNGTLYVESFCKVHVIKNALFCGMTEWK